MRFELIVIGTSMGGFKALSAILPNLEDSFDLPIAVVQHRSVLSTEQLAVMLRDYTSLPVQEARDKGEIVPGTVTLAPADYHLMVEPGLFALSTEGPVHYARPSIDVLFQSAADAYSDRLLAVVLTGAGRDGAEGVVRVKARGGGVLVQAPHTADCSALPQAAIDSVRADWILPLDAIGSFLNSVPGLTNLPRALSEVNQ